MNALEKAKELIEKHATIPRRTLLLAYIQLCMENPTAHPDGYLTVNGSDYTGWHLILVHETWGAKDVPQFVLYPSVFLRLPAVLEDLNDQLEKEYRRTNQDLDYQIWGEVQDCIDFFDNMETGSLHMPIDSLQKLYLHEADENMDEETESCMPAGVLKECGDALTWIAQQPN